MFRRLILSALVFCYALGAGASTSAPDSEDWRSPLAHGISLRAVGKHAEALAAFQEAMRLAKGTLGSAQVAVELGISLMRANRVAEAEAPLLEGYAALAGEARGMLANDLGNLYYSQRHRDLAARYYREAIELSNPSSVFWLTASLNLARTRPPERRLELLAALRPRLNQQLDSLLGVPLLINLGTQAQLLGEGGQALAYESLELAKELAAAKGSLRLQLEALDALAQLYEASGRWPDVLALTGRGLALVRDQSTAALEDVLLQFEWRQGRAFRATQKEDQALAAYQRAVELAQVIRQDLPIEFLDGQSSYKLILEPLHLGYIELLLGSLGRQPIEREQLVLGRVRDAIEVLRQSEMQDFLGDRCSVEEADVVGRVDPGTAILYPILLKDRAELLVETAKGLSRFGVSIAGGRIRDAARDFAAALRAGETGYVVPARWLYDALIGPVVPLLTEQQVQTLIIVADGELRLVPFAALRNDTGFLIERYAIAAVTGMSLTNVSVMTGKTPKALLAGVADPGDVVDKLANIEVLRSGGGTSRSLQPGGNLSKGRSLRSTASVGQNTATSRDVRAAELKKSLALPGVKDEIKSIGAALSGNVLLDGAFTVDRFRDEAEAGGYRIVHIASHGVFGGSSESSFILAYDDLLSINRLQSVLQSEVLQRTPIELLTLSACETAEGNDRAPLGIAGAAIRARAKSVLGTLWPVEDNAARMTMETFYSGIVGKMSKAAALQQAQFRLIKDSNFGHPFFWAPFILIGNWR